MPLDFETIYASKKFANPRLQPPRRAKYDFAVAYADPDSIPNAEILMCLEEALSDYGSE